MSISTLKLRLDIIRNLNTLYVELDDLIIHTKPEGDAEAAELRELLRRRDEVVESIDRLLQKGFVDTLAALEQANAQLADYNRQIHEAKRSLEGIRQGISIAAQAITVLASIALAL